MNIPKTVHRRIAQCIQNHIIQMIAIDVTQSLNDVKWSACGTQYYRSKWLTWSHNDHYSQNASNENRFVHPSVAFEIVEIVIDEVHNERSQQITDDDVRYDYETVMQYFEADEQYG